jgi:hypothetical protein
MNTKNSKSSSLKVKTSIRAGGAMNHNQTLARPTAKRALKVRTAIRAGGQCNHNQTLVRR